VLALGQWNQHGLLVPGGPAQGLLQYPEGWREEGEAEKPWGPITCPAWSRDRLGGKVRLQPRELGPSLSQPPRALRHSHKVAFAWGPWDKYVPVLPEGDLPRAMQGTAGGKKGGALGCGRTQSSQASQGHLSRCCEGGGGARGPNVKRVGGDSSGQCTLS
jgi:hypothetical protein